MTIKKGNQGPSHDLDQVCRYALDVKPRPDLTSFPYGTTLTQSEVIDRGWDKELINAEIGHLCTTSANRHALKFGAKRRHMRLYLASDVHAAETTNPRVIARREEIREKRLARMWKLAAELNVAAAHVRQACPWVP